MNPDQPLPQTAAATSAPGGALNKAGTPHARHSHKARPVPALLMKRPAREPENV